MTERKSLGDDGETLVAEALRQRGFHVIARNYRCRVGELDIVAARRNEVVFVEVKTRRTRNFGTGAESVDARKQARIVSAAQHFLATRGNGRERIRFDVVEVDATDGTPRVGHWYEGAFEAGA